MLIVCVVISASVIFSRCVSSPVPPLEEVKVRPQEDAILECRGPRDAEISLIKWMRPELTPESVVFFYRNKRPYEKYQHEFFKGRVELRDPSMKDGDFSVILRNVSLRDTGTYECHVMSRNTRSGEKVHVRDFKHSVNLTVTASGFVEKATKHEEAGAGFFSVEIGVPVAVLFLVPLVFFGVFMYRKLKKFTKCSGKQFQSPASFEFIVGSAVARR